MIAAIIQARLGSTRFPKKILQKIDNKSILEIMINRVRCSKELKDIIICTTSKKTDDEIVNLCRLLDIKFFRGSEKNVMLRYIQCAKKYNITHIVRLTSDCPFVDPNIIDKMINLYYKSNCDYLANTCPQDKSTFPNGSDVEIFTLDKLSKIYKNEKRSEFREHVTLNFWKEKKYKSLLYKNKSNLSKFRYTLDYPEDLMVIKKIYNNFKKNMSKATTNNIVDFLKRNPNVLKYNEKYK